MRAKIVLLVAAALAGCASNTSTQEWPGRDLEGVDPPWRDTTIEPGWGLEMDFGLQRDAELRYDWFVMDRTTILFEIHHHDNIGRTVTPVSKRVFEEQDVFVASTPAVHSLLWVNTEDRPLEVWVQVEGEICYGKSEGGSRCATFVDCRDYVRENGTCGPTR